MTNLTAKQKEDLNNFAQAAKNVELGTLLDEMITALDSKITEGTPVNAVNATKTLTLNSVVTDGETLTINNPAVEGVDVYEFCADEALTVTEEGNIPVDITDYAAKASRVLTIDTQPTAGDTMTIGTKKYTFVANGAADADGEISVGTDLASAKLAIVAAINGTDGHNTAHPQVSAAAFASNDCTITALVGGAAGNAIATTETYTAVTNVFAGAVLAGGSNCSAANAITALVAAVTASDTQGVGAADGTGDTVDFTADTAGTAGNAITITETMTNGSLPASTLAGGVNGTVGAENALVRDASYLYVAVAANTVSGKNWRRISLGSAY